MIGRIWEWILWSVWSGMCFVPELSLGQMFESILSLWGTMSVVCLHLLFNFSFLYILEPIYSKLSPFWLNIGKLVNLQMLEFWNKIVGNSLFVGNVIIWRGVKYTVCSLQTIHSVTFVERKTELTVQVKDPSSKRWQRVFDLKRSLMESHWQES